ncbi:MAG: TolC family outer membrane protein [Ectothiorhodospiraceae bacterium AqS1]|nr:TolC family outer membrane protein [Ectothiorhodospiraceae bacterium AqS1]
MTSAAFSTLIGDARVRLAKRRIAGASRALIGVLSLTAATTLAASADSLLRAFEQALENDPIYLAAGAENQAAQELRPQARSALLPRLTVSSNADFSMQRSKDVYPDRTSTRSSSYDSYGLFFNLSAPIYSPSLQIALEQADSRIARADALYQAAFQDLIVRVTDRYFGVLRAKDGVDFAQATLDSFARQLEQSQQRFEVGLTAITDVEEAKAGFDLANARLLSANNELAIAIESLREVSGEAVENPMRLGDIPMSLPEPADIDHWTQVALKQNLRLIAADHAVRTSYDEIRRIQIGSSRPVISASGTHREGYDGGGSGSLDSSSDSNTRLSLQLEFALYDGGISRSLVREKTQLHRKALQDLESERRRTSRDIRTAWLGLGSGIPRIEALMQAVRSSEVASEAVDTGFQVGTRSSVDVLNARRDLFEARRDLANARYDFINDMIRLRQAAGILTEADLVAVSEWLQ